MIGTQLLPLTMLADILTKPASLLSFHQKYSMIVR